MSDYLPQELLIDILSRLPVKSLLKFRCLSKSWNSLITSPDFISIQLKVSNQTKNNHQLLLRHCTKNPTIEHYTLHFHTNTNNKPSNQYLNLHFPFQSQNPYFRVVGSCNGIICIADDSEIKTYIFILWNPLVRKFVFLPEPSVRYVSHGKYGSVIGFGYDSINNDYKVVRLAYLHKNEKANLSSLPEVEVYRLSSGSWRRIDVPAVLACYKILECKKMQAMVNGEPHWLAFRRFKDGSYKNLVLYFGMIDEDFSKMVLPECLTRVMPLYLFILVVEERVAVTCYDRNSKCWDVWVRKEYGEKDSWTKQYVFDGARIVLGSWKNGHILLEDDAGEIFSCDPQRQLYEKVGIRGERGYSNVRYYVESLVLLDRPNDDNSNSGPSIESQDRYYVAPRCYVQ